MAWWDTFYRYSTLKEWTDKVTALSLPLFLRDSALCWNELVPEKKASLTQLQEAFIEEFRLLQAQLFARLGKLQALKQQPGQPVSEYLLSVAKECKVLGRSKNQRSTW